VKPSKALLDGVPQTGLANIPRLNVGEARRLRRPYSFYPRKEGHMPVRQLLELLDEHQVPYETIRRSPGVPAPDSSASSQLPSQAVAKTVPVKLDGQLALAVLPACDQLELKRLRVAAGCAMSSSLASER
jgi:hypothetical protein